MSAATEHMATELREAREAISKFRRLLNPVWMSAVEAAMVGEPLKDSCPLFRFMGSGASDLSTMADFRAAMGDEREVVASVETGDPPSDAPGQDGQSSDPGMKP